MKKNKKFTTKNLILTAIFAALTVIASQIIFQVPLSPVPFSLGITAVFLCGGILSPFFAFTSMIVYLLLGAVGLPVFSFFSGGLFRPTGGYLIAYPLMALLISLAVTYIKKGKLAVTIAATLLSLILCYAIGSVWLAVYTKRSFYDALLIGAVPYIILDLIKVLGCSFLSVAIKKRLKLI